MAAPPIPLLPPPPPLFPYTSPSLRHQVCGCVRWWRGRRGCVFHTATPPTSCQQLQAGGCLLVLVAEGGGRVCHIHRLSVWLFLPPPSPCCVVCWCQHGTCCSHPATPPPHLSWHRGLTAYPLLSSLCDSTHPSSSSRGQTPGQASTRDDDDDTGRCVPLCAPHELLMHGEHPGHSTRCNLAATEMCLCACV